MLGDTTLFAIPYLEKPTRVGAGANPPESAAWTKVVMLFRWSEIAL